MNDILDIVSRVCLCNRTDIEPLSYNIHTNSACHAFLKKWQNALEDAILCLSVDPRSIKGYYRLAQAQFELGQLPEAEMTIVGALKIDPSKPLSYLIILLYANTTMALTQFFLYINVYIPYNTYVYDNRQ